MALHNGYSFLALTNGPRRKFENRGKFVTSPLKDSNSIGIKIKSRTNKRRDHIGNSSTLGFRESEKPDFVQSGFISHSISETEFDMETYLAFQISM